MNAIALSAAKTGLLLRTFLGATGDVAEARRGAAFAFAIRVASAVIAYLSQVLLARWMGGSEYGVFAYVWVWVVVLGTVSSIGLNSSAMRFIPEYVARKDAALERGFLLWAFDGLFDEIYVIPCYLALVCLPMFTLTDTQEGTARSYSWIDLALMPHYIIRPGLLLGFLAVAVWAGERPSAETAVYAAIGATWLAAIGQTFVLERRLKQRVAPGPRAWRFRHWVSVSTPIFLVVAFFMLLQNTDILVMNLYLTSLDVAMYFAATKTTSLISFIYYAITAAYAHRFASYDAAGDMEGLAEVLREAVVWTFWPSVVAAVGILIMGWPLLWLFGEEFTAAYPVMFVLVVGLLARAAVGPIDYMLSMLGQQKACAGVLGLSVAVNLGLNFLLIPEYGLMGAAVATTVATIMATFLLYRLAKRRLGLESIFWQRRKAAPADR